MFAGRGSGLGDVFGAGISFLQPGYAHTLAEKRRQALRREETGEGAPPEVDLDAGVICLTPPPAARQDAAGQDAGRQDAAREDPALQGAAREAPALQAEPDDSQTVRE